jgi:hypothetical protein
MLITYGRHRKKAPDSKFNYNVILLSRSDGRYFYTRPCFSLTTQVPSASLSSLSLCALSFVRRRRPDGGSWRQTRAALASPSPRRWRWPPLMRAPSTAALRHPRLPIQVEDIVADQVPRLVSHQLHSCMSILGQSLPWSSHQLRCCEAVSHPQPD